MEKETQTPKRKPRKTIEGLIEIQWAVIDALSEKLKNPDLTTIEYTKAASALAIHISNITKLLRQDKENCESEEQNLGEYVTNVSPRTHRRWDFRIWKRRLSLRR